MPRRLSMILAVLLVAAFGIGLLIAPHAGWATPLGMPSHFGYRGKDYYVDANGAGGRIACATRFPRSYRPVRQVGSIFGYFTGSKPILLPYYERHYRVDYSLLVADGSCLRIYRDVADGP
jgi:hypothetical protein